MSIGPWEIAVNVELPPPAIRPGNRDAAAVAEMFGLGAGEASPTVLYDDFRLTVAPGEIVAIVGPSGAGKSCLLRAIASAAPEAISLDAARAADDDRPAIATLSDDGAAGRMLARLCGAEADDEGDDESTLGERLAILSRCGLAEASVLLTPGRFLSGGQAYRLALASAIWRAVRRGCPTLLLADEFAAILDDATAGVLAGQVGKLVRRYQLGLVVATPRAQLAAALGARRMVVKPLAGAASIARVKPAEPPRWRVTRGSIADYRALAGFHYLAHPPAAHKRVWTIRVPVRRRIPGGPELAAVLTVSPPVLRCRGRNVATAGRYVRGDRRRDVRRLNAEIECISRVVVHPIYRGCGLAVRLVRRALAGADTPFVESLAAMGAVHPFLELAGMTCHGHFGQGRGYQYYLARTRRR